MDLIEILFVFVNRQTNRKKKKKKIAENEKSVIVTRIEIKIDRVHLVKRIKKRNQGDAVDQDHETESVVNVNENVSVNVNVKENVKKNEPNVNEKEKENVNENGNNTIINEPNISSKFNQE